MRRVKSLYGGLPRAKQPKTPLIEVDAQRQIGKRERLMRDDERTVALEHCGFRYAFPAIEKIVFGEPASKAIASEVEGRRKRRVLVLTSSSLRQSELVYSVANALGSSHSATFSKISAGSPRSEILAAAALAREVSADLLVAIGGGSVIDAAKLVQLCIWEGLLKDEELDHYSGDALQTLTPASDPIRTIAVPTTLSAAEFASLGGSYNPATGRKEPFDHPLFVPAVVVADPAALAQSPESLIVSTGVRTIDHCVERFCSNRTHAYSAALATGALRILLQYLIEVHENRATPTAYGQLQLASWMSMNAVNAGVPVGASQAIGRVLGATAGVPHGQTSAILLPAVLAWNEADAVAAKRQRHLLAEIGLEGELPQVIADYIAALSQPRRLSTVGVRRDQFARIAQDSMVMLQHPSVSGNLRKVESEADVLAILERAW